MSRRFLSTITLTFQIVDHWICQQQTLFQSFLQSRLKWGLNIEQPPCYHHYQAQSEVLTQSSMLFQRQQRCQNVGLLCHLLIQHIQLI